MPPLLALVILGPLLAGRGFWSFGDMVFVPRQPWKPEWYGGDGGVPRAVPGDALVSLATQLVPGDLLQKAVLLGLLSTAGWGVQRLLRGASGPAQVAASVLFVWNPYVLERLAIGHWALLCGYAALPWVASGAARMATQGRTAWAWLAVPGAVAAWTSPTGGVLALVVAAGVVVVTAPSGVRLRRGAGAIGLLVLLDLPWLVPGLLTTTGGPVDQSGAVAFAARADTPYGLVGSLVTLGGIWKTSVVPADRADPVSVGIAVTLSLLALLGVLLGLVVGDRRTLLGGLAVTALPLFVLVVVSATGPGRSASGWLVTGIPGGGLVRDTQKWLAVPALLLAVGLGVLLDGVARWLASHPRRPPVSVLLAVALAPLVALPSLAWGHLGDWRRSTYPPDWAVVAGRVGADPVAARQGTVVLPFGVYRRFAWNDEQAWLDPAPRLLPGRVLVDDTLTLGEDAAVAGESIEAARVRAAAGSWESLGPVLDDLGIRFVLVERGTPGPLPTGTAPPTAYTGETLALHDRGEQRATPPRPGRDRPLLLLDAALLALVAAACGAIARSRLRRGYTRRGRHPDRSETYPGGSPR